MKKIHLIFAGVFTLAMGLASCSSSEEPVSTENAGNFEFSKTQEMLDFESALKGYMIAKQGDPDGKKKTVDEQNMKENAIRLLKSLNQADLSNEQAETDDIVTLAMKEYSKKLTEMYKQRSK
jgi:hypothetical protein